MPGYHKGVFILFIDVDWFKVNDNHGHVTEAYMVELGRHSSSMVRIGRRVRYGGDEFVIILTETNAVAPRHCRRVASPLNPTSSEPGNIRGGITVSIGAAGYPEHGSSVDY